jgi:hypothetical protein
MTLLLDGSAPAEVTKTRPIRTNPCLGAAQGPGEVVDMVIRSLLFLCPRKRNVRGWPNFRQFNEVGRAKSEMPMTSGIPVDPADMVKQASNETTPSRMGTRSAEVYESVCSPQHDLGLGRGSGRLPLHARRWTFMT